MRLEKLSCIEQDGHIIETDVDGYISGEDGKNGMRGRVVLRDAEVLKRGFLGGLLSGLGKAVNHSFTTTTVSPLGATSNVNGKDIFKSAGAQGAGDAFELMARYNIQRAEQYQPVIQISAGRVVNVVFHSGSKFGEKKTRKKEEVNSGPKVGNIFGE
jgi:conjugal transfer pilus assembly protein TraB